MRSTNYSFLQIWSVFESEENDQNLADQEQCSGEDKPHTDQRMRLKVPAQTYSVGYVSSSILARRLRLLIYFVAHDEYVHLRSEKDQKDQFEESEEADILLATKTEDHAATIDSYDSSDDEQYEPDVTEQVKLAIDANVGQQAHRSQLKKRAEHLEHYKSVEVAALLSFLPVAAATIPVKDLLLLLLAGGGTVDAIVLTTTFLTFLSVFECLRFPIILLLPIFILISRYIISFCGKSFIGTWGERGLCIHYLAYGGIIVGVYPQSPTLSVLVKHNHARSLPHVSSLLQLQLILLLKLLRMTLPSD